MASCFVGFVIKQCLFRLWIWKSIEDNIWPLPHLVWAWRRAPGNLWKWIVKTTTRYWWWSTVSNLCSRTGRHYDIVSCNWICCVMHRMLTCIHHLPMCIHMYGYLYIYTDIVHIYVYIYIYIYTHVYRQVYIYIYYDIYIYRYTLTHV